jgi:hypothetical protein
MKSVLIMPTLRRILPNLKAVPQNLQAVIALIFTNQKPMKRRGIPEAELRKSMVTALITMNSKV